MFLFFFLQWKEGDEVPESWRDFYTSHPCVPIDYTTISGALSVAQNTRLEQIHSIHVLLRPAKYVLNETITVNAERDVHVSIETIEMPESILPKGEVSTETEPKRRRRSGSILKYLTCRSVETEVEEEFDFTNSASSYRTASSSIKHKHAILTFKSQEVNKPIFRIYKGQCTLRNLRLDHISYGADIWNGNAAIQIQPPLGLDDQPIMVSPAPTAILDHVDIISASGRGIVNIDGGCLAIRHCCIHDCAATGIYVGGLGSQVTIDHTDVIRNGNGNSRHRRGIARGHSGIYLEQGLAKIANSNISQNSLTGISAVSPSNAILHLEDSELVSNGAFQLEMPNIGTRARRQSSTRNVTLMNVGLLSRSRSGFYDENEIVRES